MCVQQTCSVHASHEVHYKLSKCKFQMYCVLLVVRPHTKVLSFGCSGARAHTHTMNWTDLAVMNDNLPRTNKRRLCMTF